jgi:copper chaperone CopZ
MSDGATELTIDGMSCAHCVRAVKDALERVAGVSRAVVEIGTAHVEHDERVDRDALVRAITDAGFSPR